MPANLINAELWRYRLLLREALTVPNGALASRDGLLLRLTDDAGAVGIGEIAPLPGLHSETLAQAEEQVLSWLRGNLAKDVRLFSSVQCGVEMAEWSLQNRLQASNCQTLQPINALVSGGKDTIVSKARKAVQEGYTTLKIKVGRHSLEDDIHNILAVREGVGSEICLRLDANRSWSLEAALRLGFAVSDANIEYIEEPLRDWRDIPTFTEKTGIKVALDEMLYSPNEEERRQRLVIPSEALAAYVLKPSAIGGIEAASNLALEALSRNLQPVLSSVFETGVSLSFYASLQASFMTATPIPCGLDTFKFLAEDVLQTPFAAERGFVRLPEVLDNRIHLRSEALQRIL